MVGNVMHRNSSDSIKGPVRVGIFAANGLNSGRVSAGASYWGIMELSGNVWERTVTIGKATGRAFTGTHGDGLLTNSGDADAATWPAEGLNFRGGSWDDNNLDIQVSYRYYAEDTYSSRYQSYGFRAVRR
jgi:formylglycine-generating enzyme required for sulfatase activity